MTMTMIRPSTYQQAIYDFIEHGQGNGIVRACAGAGKTTTLVQAARLIDNSGIFLAFNADIAKVLAERLKGTNMVAKTLHSLGNGCLFKVLGKTQVEGKKYRDLLKQHNLFGKDRDELLLLINFCRLTLTNPHDLAAVRGMIGHYGLDIAIPELCEQVPYFLDLGDQLAREQKLIDFTDMIYLPIAWNLSIPTFDWVMIDECQDLNSCQLELVLRAATGRILAVGDPNQAIYSFAGANADSFWQIQEKTQAVEFPLSICYRCPTEVITLAQALVPEIEARPDAPAGVVGQLAEDKLARQLQKGDLILCRKTAPLIELCINLIGQRISATVRGRDLATKLTSMVREVAQLGLWGQFGDLLQQYRQEKTQKLGDNEAAIESLADRCAAVAACYLSFNAVGAGALCEEIESLFSDAKCGVVLSTVHRAKGLEAERVFILKPECLPLVWPKQKAHEYAQELNLKYVAYTRAQREMYFIV